VVGKRARLEKNQADERRPQELREEDIARSENETTKHVIDVSPFPLKKPDVS
jgi:non-structural maintenance of chromosomes element 4